MVQDSVDAWRAAGRSARGRKAGVLCKSAELLDDSAAVGHGWDAAAQVLGDPAGAVGFLLHAGRRARRISFQASARYGGAEHEVVVGVGVAGCKVGGTCDGWIFLFRVVTHL